MATLWLVALATLLAISLGAPALAHEVRPAVVQITEHRPGDYDVVWKQPVVGDMAIHLVPHLSSGVLDKPPASETGAEGFRVRTWRVRGGPPLDGQTVSIEGLPQSVTDVLLRVTTAEGKTLDDVIRPAEASRRLSLSGPQGLVVPAYLALGVQHILTGIDHLMFVLGLLLLIGPSWRLVKAITAFTVSHSLSLGLAALGFVTLPPAIIEALVALSIVFVACELVRPQDGPPTLTRKYPWLIAFSFGLLHGLAFAGALAEVGLPRNAKLAALFMFNLGVEIGQLAFIGAALGVMWLMGRVVARAPAAAPAWARLAPGYVIGGFSAYWLIERVFAAV